MANFVFWAAIFALGVFLVIRALSVLKLQGNRPQVGRWYLVLWVGFGVVISSAIPLILDVIEWIVRNFDIKIFFS